MSIDNLSGSVIRDLNKSYGSKLIVGGDSARLAKLKTRQKIKSQQAQICKK